MYIIRKNIDKVGAVTNLVGTVFMMLGVFCLFFGISPNGINPKAPNEAWSLASPLFGAAFILFAVSWFKKKKR